MSRCRDPSNGEINNFQEQRHELADVECLSSSSDTEVVLNAYVRWGLEAVVSMRHLCDGNWGSAFQVRSSGAPGGAPDESISIFSSGDGRRLTVQGCLRGVPAS